MSDMMTVETRVNAFLALAREKARDGLTVAELGSLVLEVLKIACGGLDAVRTLDGPAKRALALQAVGVLFDSVAGAAVPWAAWPLWIAARPVLRVTLLAFAGGLLESLLPTLRSAPA
jgi:hypothetical protein